MKTLHLFLILSAIFLSASGLKCYYCQTDCDKPVVQNCEEVLGQGVEAKCLDFSYKTEQSSVLTKTCIAATYNCDNVGNIGENGSCNVCDTDLCNNGEQNTEAAASKDEGETAEESKSDDVAEAETESPKAAEEVEEIDGDVDVEDDGDAEDEEGLLDGILSFLGTLFSFGSKKNEL